MTDDPNRLLNISEVATYLRVPLRSVKRIRGELPFRRVGRVEVVSVADVEAWLLATSLAQTARVVPEEPLPPRFTLYRFYDDAGELLYVGLTTQGAGRWHAHAKDQPWWLEVDTIRVEHLDSLAELAAAEIAAIRTENPKYNKVGRA